jgi:hypothetical protein
MRERERERERERDANTVPDLMGSVSRAQTSLGVIMTPV